MAEYIDPLWEYDGGSCLLGLAKSAETKLGSKRDKIIAIVWVVLNMAIVEV
jgi:hypothetical protein